MKRHCCLPQVVSASCLTRRLSLLQSGFSSICPQITSPVWEEKAGLGHKNSGTYSHSLSFAVSIYFTKPRQTKLAVLVVADNIIIYFIISFHFDTASRSSQTGWNKTGWSKETQQSERHLPAYQVTSPFDSYPRPSAGNKRGSP